MRGVTLIYLQGAPLLRRADGALGVHHKTASGLQAYLERWHGPVALSCLQPPVPASGQSGIVWEGDPRVAGVLIRPSMDGRAFRGLAPLVIHAPVNAPGVGSLIGVAPLVLGDDYSPRVRTQVAVVAARGRLDAARIIAGSLRRTRRFDRLATQAAGFHANGYASATHYRQVNYRTLMYFDHRIRAADLAGAVRTARVADRRPLHLAFSGRFEDMKGIHYIPALVRELRARGIEVEFTAIGSGPGEGQLRSEPLVDVHGYMDFDTTWKTYFRDQVDIAVLPHIQGDSSSTYYEAMGMGVPVLGFRNATLTPTLADGGGGWEVRRGDVRGLAAQIERLAADRGLIEEQRSRAIAYMRDKTMEAIFDRRIADFERVVDQL